MGSFLDRLQSPGVAVGTLVMLVVLLRGALFPATELQGWVNGGLWMLGAFLGGFLTPDSARHSPVDGARIAAIVASVVGLPLFVLAGGLQGVVASGLGGGGLALTLAGAAIALPFGLLFGLVSLVLAIPAGSLGGTFRNRFVDDDPQLR